MSHGEAAEVVDRASRTSIDYAAARSVDHDVGIPLRANGTGLHGVSTITLAFQFPAHSRRYETLSDKPEENHK